MRKLMIAAAMAAVALGTAAGCTTAPPGGSPTSTPPATQPADDTKAVCSEAIATANQASAAVMAKYAEGAQALAAGDTAKALAAATDGKKLLTDWSTAYKTLSAKQIKPDVKTAIDNIAAFADQTAAATSADPAALQSTFADLNGKLTTACAAA